MKPCYLDSSAIVKLVVREPESEALRAFVRKRISIASALVRTEVIRAVQPHGQAAVSAARAALVPIRLVRITEGILDDAATLQPSSLRSPDAIHLATARLLGDELAEFVAYDKRLLDAARTTGFSTASPG